MNKKPMMPQMQRDIHKCKCKNICSDRCEKWYCTKCVNIADVLYSFLASKEAEDIAWVCKDCKEPARKAVIEDKCIEGRYT